MMYLCDEVISVFNARVNGDSGEVEYLPTVIRGASWHGEKGEALSDEGGMRQSGKITARIPADADAGGKRWAEPEAWRGAGEPGSLWTLACGDIIVRGKATGGGWTLRRIRESFSERATVLAVADNRRAPNAPHWRVSGR